MDVLLDQYFKGGEDVMERLSLAYVARMEKIFSWPRKLTPAIFRGRKWEVNMWGKYAIVITLFFLFFGGITRLPVVVIVVKVLVPPCLRINLLSFQNCGIT